MLLRKIRLTGLFSVGLAFALISLVWIFFFDVYIKTEVLWLYVGLLFGVVPSGLLMLGSYFSNDEEKIASSIIIGVSIALTITLIVFLFIAQQDPKIIAAAKKNDNLTAFRVMNIIIIIISILSLVVSIGGLVLDILAKIKAKKENLLIEDALEPKNS